MVAVLSHRGPDDSGTWLDENTAVALGHRRLSIIDLSSSGRQPMVSSCGRFVISFNGEIYNFHELRGVLSGLGRRFETGTDTEVILEAVSEWGFTATLPRLWGMFAFALFDRGACKMYLVRDRVGKKPLYFSFEKGLLIFGSELKAICANPHFSRDIDLESLALFLRYQYIPSPKTIFSSAQKILPGYYAVIESDGQRAPMHYAFVPYWSPLSFISEPNGNNGSSVSDEEAVIAQLETLLDDAVRRRLIADVPVGVLLSGGIDSSLVAAFAQRAATRPVKTFTIGFHESSLNEANHARLVAESLGTDHTELYASPREALAVIPSLPDIYDEPFADSSQIPTYLVCKLARERVTVALSGDGGDELFGGYNRYFLARTAWDVVGRLPLSLRRSVSRVLTAVRPGTWDSLVTIAQMLPGSLFKQRLAGNKIHKLAGILLSPSADAIYHRLVMSWDDPSQVLMSHSMKDNGWLDDHFSALDERGVSDLTDRMMLLDLRTYLPEDILVKVDRASMAVSLEVRAPLLDHRVVEFAISLPQKYKVRKLVSKWIMRKLLYHQVPRERVDRPKLGFGVPLAQWLRGPLRPWAEDLLSIDALRRTGILRIETVRHYWDRHRSGARDWEYRLWPILMLQGWFQRWASNPAFP